MILVTVAVYLSFKFLLPLLLPFIIAFLVAWLIKPISEYLYHKLKLPRIAGGIISVILLVILLGYGFYYLCATLLKQGVEFLKDLPIYTNRLMYLIDQWCSSCEALFGLEEGSMVIALNDTMNEGLASLRNSIMPYLTNNTFSIIIAVVTGFGILIIMIIATILIIKEIPEINEKYGKKQVYQDIQHVIDELIAAGSAYFRSQLVIMVVVAFYCVVGLTFMENEYALLIGVLIAIMDALPILGSGMILVPWAIIMLFSGDILSAAILITVYLLSQITREILEPKIIGHHIGIKPLYTLIAMYIGLKLFSIVGFILGPLGLILIINIVKIINTKSNKTSPIVLANGSEKKL